MSEIVTVHGRSFYLTDEQVKEIENKHDSLLIFGKKLDRLLRSYSDEQLGNVIRKCREYQINGNIPEIEPELKYVLDDFMEGVDYNRKTYLESSVSKSAISKKSTKYKEITDSDSADYFKKIEERIKELEKENSMLKQQLITDDNERCRVITSVIINDNDTESESDNVNDTDTEKDSKGETKLQTFDEAYNFLRTIEPNYHVSGRDHNLLVDKIQNDYKNGIRYSESKLDEFAKNAPSICQTIIDNQRGNRAI